METGTETKEVKTTSTSAVPDRKVQWSVAAGVIAAAVTWGVRLAFDVDLPVGVIEPVIVIVMGLVAYFVPPSVRDVMDRVETIAATTARHPETNTPAVATAAATLRSEVRKTGALT